MSHIWSRICLPVRITWDHPQLLAGSCCLVFSLISCVFCTNTCLFVFLFFSHGLSVYFRFMSLNVPLVSFALLLLYWIKIDTMFCILWTVFFGMGMIKWNLSLLCFCRFRTDCNQILPNANRLCRNRSIN